MLIKVNATSQAQACLDSRVSRDSLRSGGSARKRSGARPRALKARLWVHAVKVRRSINI